MTASLLLRRLAPIGLLLAVGAGSASAAPAVSASRGQPAVGKIVQGDEGTVIRGDQEAPLVLYIVPWQDPKPQPLPEAPLIPLLLKAYDHDRSLIDDPANQSLDAVPPPGR